eukprot:75889_1
MNPTRVPTSNPLACSDDDICGQKKEFSIRAGESNKYCGETTACFLSFSGVTDERLYFILKLADQNEERIFTLGNPGETYTYATNGGNIGNVELIVKNEGTGTNALMFSLSCDCSY